VNLTSSSCAAAVVHPACCYAVLEPGQMQLTLNATKTFQIAPPEFLYKRDVVANTQPSVSNH